MDKKPLHARVPQSVAKMSIADKKTFLNLYRSGATNNAYEMYLGLPLNSIIWLKENIKMVEKEISDYEKEKEERIMKKKEEARKENEIARKEGTLKRKPEEKLPMRGLKSNKVIVSKSGMRVKSEFERHFWLDSMVRTPEWLAEQYFGEVNKNILKAVKREISRVARKYEK